MLATNGEMSHLTSPADVHIVGYVLDGRMDPAVRLSKHRLGSESGSHEEDRTIVGLAPAE